MTYTIQKLTQNNAELIANQWHYSGRYSFYDFKAGSEKYRKFVDSIKRGDNFFQVYSDDELIGYFEFERTTGDTETLAVILGMAPARTGQGEGKAFVYTVLSYMQRLVQSQTIVFDVAAFNIRAQKVFQLLGFHYEQMHEEWINGVNYPFITMKHPQPTLPIMDYDADPHGVIDPFRHEGFHFPEKFLYAFIPADNIALFLAQYPHEEIGYFKTFFHHPIIYQVTIGIEKIGFCQAFLGAPAATELLDFLIAYGAQQIIAVGSCGVLTDVPEGFLLVPTVALRDEGTSYHYLPATATVQLDHTMTTALSAFLTQQQRPYLKVKTWTNGAIFRETPKRVTAIREAGFTVVEMECAALAACAQFRHAQFTQLLFSGDFLADVNTHEPRDFGANAHLAALELGLAYLHELPEKKQTD